MSIIQQNSRISHHTTTTGITFSIPSQEDFTLRGTQSWTASDLALSEIGIDELRNKAFVRIGNHINELAFVATGSTPGGSGEMNYLSRNGLSASWLDIVTSNDLVYGLGLTFSAKYTGNVYVNINFNWSSGSGIGSYEFYGRYGTGIPPINGATTSIGDIFLIKGAIYNRTEFVDLSGILEGLTPGEVYWFDIGVKAIADIAYVPEDYLTNIYYSIIELAAPSSGGSGAGSLSETLAIGNNTGPNNITIDTNQQIQGPSYSHIQLGTTGNETRIRLDSSRVDPTGSITEFNSYINVEPNIVRVNSEDSTTGENSAVIITPTRINLTAPGADIYVYSGSSYLTSDGTVTITADRSNYAPTILLQPNLIQTTVQSMSGDTQITQNDINIVTSINGVIETKASAIVETSSVGTQSLATITGLLNGEMIMVKGYVNAKSSVANQIYSSEFSTSFNFYDGVLHLVGNLYFYEAENMGDGTTIEVTTDGTDILINVIPNNSSTIRWATIYEYTKNSLI